MSLKNLVILVVFVNLFIMLKELYVNVNCNQTDHISK